ncbi:hypothetical protein FQN57_000134 [Myotisia sp. PD_48]|nr:hypothetical protein FQN57_000134 [Myotisia sp. PD_48]
MPVAWSKRCNFVAVLSGQLLTLQQKDKNDKFPRSIALNDNVAGSGKFLQWSTCPNSTASSSSIGRTVIPEQEQQPQRVLCATANQILVFDVDDETWSAEINTGEKPNSTAAFAHLEFGSFADEIIAISEYSSQLTIFSLSTGGQRIIKSLKCSDPAYYAFRPRSGHLATILKADSGDVLSVHELRSYEVIRVSTIPTTDAKGLKWSPDGNWLAIWDAASAGTMVVIFTADGQKFRTFEGSKDDDIDFGVKIIEWSPDSRILALGKHDGTIILLNGLTFTIMAILGDPMVQPIERNVYTEQELGHGATEYMPAPESRLFPFTFNVPNENRVVSMISFNPSGTKIATIDKGLPQVVWMWSIQGRDQRLIGALVLRSPARQLHWNVQMPELLMVLSDDSDTARIHQWIHGRVPRVASVSGVSGKFGASWVYTEKEDSGLFCVSGLNEYKMGCLVGTGQLAQFYEVMSSEAHHPSLCEDDFPTK